MGANYSLGQGEGETESERERERERREGETENVKRYTNVYTSRPYPERQDGHLCSFEIEMYT